MQHWIVLVSLSVTLEAVTELLLLNPYVIKIAFLICRFLNISLSSELTSKNPPQTNPFKSFWFSEVFVFKIKISSFSETL